MKQRFPIFLVCNALLLTAGFNATSQTSKKKTRSPAQIAINRIDSIVNTICKDSTLTWTTLTDTEKRLTGGKRTPKESTTTRAAYQNGQLVILQIMNGDFMNSRGRIFYFL